MVGYGIATLSSLLILSKISKPLRIVIFDPYFDGGLLRRRYGKVRSNTTWYQFVDAVAPFCGGRNEENLRIRANEVTPLEDLVSALLKVVQSPCIPKEDSQNLQITYICEEVKTIREDSFPEGGNWIINNTTKAKIVLLNYGAHPKCLKYPKPTLQLDAVLNGNQLPCIRGQKVIIFGTMHSGVLCINRLIHEGIRVVAVYNGNSPFKFTRDGEYDGLKQESASIADYLLNCSIAYISSNDEERIKAELETCDWVLYACGFTANEGIMVYDCNGGQIDIRNYDEKTGSICGRMNLFGYGIAYPSSTMVNEKKYFDVSLPAFMNHIGGNMDLILKYLEK